MTEKPTLRRRQAPRALEIACGIGLALLGPLLIFVFARELPRVSTAPKPVGALILSLIFIAFGIFCCLLAVRLLRSGSSRNGLLSPRGWRIAGWVFLATAAVVSIAAATQKAWPGVFVVLVSTAPIIRWCFVAARDADANKPLQPTRAAQPNGKREPAGSGPRG